MSWKVGKVKITKIVEIEVAGGTRFMLPQFFHAQDATFMTFRIEAVRQRDNAQVDVLALERFLFRRGLIVELDVYWKSIRDENCWWAGCSRFEKDQRVNA